MFAANETLARCVHMRYKIDARRQNFAVFARNSLLYTSAAGQHDAFLMGGRFVPIKSYWTGEVSGPGGAVRIPGE